MMTKLLNLAVGFLLRRVVREEVRVQSLKAVRAYVATIANVRLGVMAMAALIGIIAMLVAGVILVVGSLLALFDVSEEALAWIQLAAGLLFTSFGVVTLAILFNQKRWLQLSKSYDLMDAVIEPVPTVASIPKNFVRAFKGEPTVHATRETIKPPPVHEAPDRVHSNQSATPLRPQEA